MASDEWVADVRRWYFAGALSRPVAPQAEVADGAEAVELGYEAADPALQARHWPDAPRDTSALR